MEKISKKDLLKRNLLYSHSMSAKNWGIAVCQWLRLETVKSSITYFPLSLYFPPILTKWSTKVSPLTSWRNIEEEWEFFLYLLKNANIPFKMYYIVFRTLCMRSPFLTDSLNVQYIIIDCKYNAIQQLSRAYSSCLIKTLCLLIFLISLFLIPW